MFFSIIMILHVLAAGAPSAAGEPVLVDKLAGVVNEEIITYSDVNRAMELYPVFQQQDEDKEAFRIRILDLLIDYRVIAMEYRDEIKLTAEDYEEVQRSIIEKLGSLDNLMALLENYGMDWQAFKKFITDKVIFEKVVREKFQMRIAVQYREIESFYNGEYLPTQKRLQLPERSLVEMAPLIEKHLRKEKSRKRINSWLQDIRSRYQIENLLLSSSRNRWQPNERGVHDGPV